MVSYYLLGKQFPKRHSTVVGLCTTIFLYHKTEQTRVFSDAQKGFPLQSRLWQ